MRQLRSRTACALLLVAAPPLAGQRPAEARGAITIVIGAEPTLPVPTLSNAQANVEVSSLLFLRLARIGKRQSTVDEGQFEPQLARRCTRRDPLTLVFDLDTR